MYLLRTAMKHKINSTFFAPIIILVRPQLAENIGMVARAMMNCGLSELRLVAPKKSCLSKEALSAASGAQVILEQAKVYDTLDGAIEDVEYLMATTARGRGMNKPVVQPAEAVKILKEKVFQKQNVGILFGPERTGLENDDIIFANSLLTIPLNPLHPSLNLAQAVLLVGWCWWQESLTKVKGIKVQGIASKKELDFFLKFLIERLENKNYFSIENKKEKMQQNLKNIFTKSLLTSSEIKTLYRVIKRLCNGTLK